MHNQPFPAALLSRISRDDDQIRLTQRIKRSIWQSLDDFIPKARQEIDLLWPESVFMPFGLWPYFFETHYNMPNRSFNLYDPMSRGMAQVIACLAPWRPTQDIVKFDPEIEKELKDMDFDGKLPTDTLLRLPAWSVYIDCALRVDGDDYDGFFVQLDSNKAGLYMAFTFHGADYRQQRVPFFLGDMSFAESIAAIDRVNRLIGEAPNVRGDDPGLLQALNLVTYLCAYGFGDSPDYTASAVNRPIPRKTKKGWRIFPPDKPKTHMLGAEFGEKIRGERQGAVSGGTKKPHVRRPHWHHFWKGSREEKSLIVRWLPPIFVGSHEMEEVEN